MLAMAGESILFVSRRDSLRSVLAAACLQHVSRGELQGYTCGVPGEIAEAPHEAALRALATASLLPRQKHHPQDWNVFRRWNAVRMRFVIVLDEYAGSRLDTWPNQPDTAHWVYPDLLRSGPPGAADVMQQLHSLRQRLEILASLPLHKADRVSLAGDVRDLGHL